MGTEESNEHFIDIERLRRRFAYLRQELDHIWRAQSRAEELAKARRQFLWAFGISICGLSVTVIKGVLFVVERHPLDFMAAAIFGLLAVVFGVRAWRLYDQCF